MGPDALQLIFVPITVLGGLTGLIWGIATSGRPSPEATLDRNYGIETATPARRLGGYLLEIPLVFLTLLIGWFIWFAIVAPRGQTPAKALLSTYVMREDGTTAGGWYMWGRELLVKGLLLSILNIFTFSAAWVVASLWCLWDPDRQTVWDKIMTSYVAYSPYGSPVPAGQEAVIGAPVGVGAASPDSRLRELQQLRADGIITAEEYEERRQRLTGQP